MLDCSNYSRGPQGAGKDSLINKPKLLPYLISLRLSKKLNPLPGEYTIEERFSVILPKARFGYGHNH
jgi:hypothetical protein